MTSSSKKQKIKKTNTLSKKEVKATAVIDKIFEQEDDGSENASQGKVENKDENTEESIHLSPEQEKLLKAIEKLKSDKVYMKKGSKGTRVGTVQKFLNLYFHRSDRIDNDYGPHTIELVREFQKKEGLDVDGYAGPGTYAKMIELIKEKKVS